VLQLLIGDGDDDLRVAARQGSQQLGVRSAHASALRLLRLHDLGEL
jgi:hypothetical protein